MLQESNINTILAVETSCDETGVAVLEKIKNEIKISASELSSQAKLHQKYGGVYPNVAIREHNKNLPLLLKKTITQAKNPCLDAVAVTIGPGLEPCLWEGVNFVKKIAESQNLPVIPINHMEAHILINFLGKKIDNQESRMKNLFPAVALLVSGGHTQLVLVKSIGSYQILGETRDDAAGECFDKSARILGLSYPGGPEIAARAERFAASNFNEKFEINLPRPMIRSRNYDFSFSGLKTAVLYDHRSRSPKIRKSKQYIEAMCYEIEQAVVDVLAKKTIKAAKDYIVKTIILGGGVAANKKLKQTISKETEKKPPGVRCLFPPARFATDNAVMVGVAAFFHPEKAAGWQEIKVNANLRLSRVKC